MVIKNISDISGEKIPGKENITKKIVLGPADGSEEIVVRYFRLEPGAGSPRHTHPFPHLVHVTEGLGFAIDSAGEKHLLKEGNHIYVAENELHSFENSGENEFCFYCTVPARGEK